METKVAVSDSFLTVVIGGLVAAVTYMMGGVDKLFVAFTIFVSLDVLTGFLRAVYLNEVESREIFWGLIRKGLLIVLIIMSHQLDIIFGSEEGYMRTAMLLFIVGAEGVSIIENLGKMGLPAPVFITQVFKKLQGVKNSDSEGKGKDKDV